MKTLTNFIAALVIISMIAGFLSGLYYGASYLWTFYVELDYVTRVLLLTSVVTLIVVVMVISNAIKSNGISVQKSQMVSMKLSLYKQLIQSYGQLIADYLSGVSIEKNHKTQTLYELQTDLLLLGSKPILEACNKLDGALQDEEQSDQVITKHFDSLVKNIRRDMGHHQIYDDVSSLFLTIKSKNNSELEEEKNQPVYN